MKKVILLLSCVCSMITYAQEDPSAEDAFYSSSTKPVKKVMVYFGTVPSGEKVNRTFVKFNAVQPDDEPGVHVYKIISYELQFNGVFFTVSGSELTEEMSKAINLAPRKTKVSGLFKVKDQEGVVRMLAGTWVLR